MANFLQGSISANKIEYEAIAKNVFKQTINISDAIVSIFSNTGIAGFKFHVPENEQVKMQSEITDHYIDTGSAVQDHIARRPIVITVRGYQGEYYYTVHPIENMISKVVPVLALVKEFKPKLDPVTERIKKRREELALIQLSKDGKKYTKTYENKILDKEFNAVDLFKLFQDLYKLKSAQTRAFYFFQALWESEALFSVETRWKRYDNMGIQDITPLGDNNADITDFSVSFKQISITTSKVENIKNVAGRLKEQAAKVTKKGIDKGKEVDTLNPQKGN